MYKFPLNMDYFTNNNPENIYIEEREGEEPNLVVWQDNSIIDECLTLANALQIARDLVKEGRKGRY